MFSDKLKGLFKRQKEQAEDENKSIADALKETSQGPGEIQIDENYVVPEDRAKSVKKKAVMVVAAGVAIFTVTAVASNVLFKSSPEDAKGDKPLTSTANASANPAQGFPEKYSDMEKYQKDAQQKNGGKPQTGQQVITAEGPAGRSSPRPSGGATYVPTSYSGATGNGGIAYAGGAAGSTNSDRAAERAADQAEKERLAVVNSALAFKVATEIAQGNLPAITPLANATTSAPVQQASYRFSEEDTPASNGAYNLNAGTVIQATLLTGVTSDVPNGDVVAQVRQDVYDSLTGMHLLIPQGSRLIGVSGAAGNSGNKRIGVVFKRVILPNGASLTLPDQKAIDGTGYPGLMDRYTDHRGKAYSSAFTSALLSALAQSATGNTSGDDARSPGQEAVSGAVASVLQTGQKMVEKDLQATPTIEIQPGFQFSVFINQDLLIGEYIDI